MELGDRKYDVYLESDRIRRVAWHDGGNSYCVSNSLLNTLTNDQMLGIARSVDSVMPDPKPRPRRRGNRGRR